MNEYNLKKILLPNLVLLLKNFTIRKTTITKKMKITGTTTAATGKVALLFSATRIWKLNEYSSNIGDVTTKV